VRYRLLETARQYGSERLSAEPGHEPTRRKHAEYFLAVAESGNLSVEAIGRPSRYELIRPEGANIRAAIDWATLNDAELGLRIVVSLGTYWTGHSEEFIRMSEALLERSEGTDPVVRARAWRNYGGPLQVLGRLDEAWDAYATAGELFEAAGDEARVAETWMRRGVVAYDRGDFDEARTLFEDSLEVFRRVGDRPGELQVLTNLGSLELETEGGDRERGLALLELALEMGRAAGWVWGVAIQLQTLAMYRLVTGELTAARANATEFLTLAPQIGDRNQVRCGVALLAAVAAQEGDAERAVELWSAVEHAEPGPGRFWNLDREWFAPFLPDRPLPEPMPLDAAAELALS
jgi:tetratricopeptide (TPR) repeat protein